MALKLLNPSLRPLGQFDLADDQTLVGGECVKLQAKSPVAGDAAWDSKNVGPFSNTNQVEFALGIYETGKLCGLADEGSSGYGTSFGTQIGQGAGQGVQIPLNTGAYTAGGVTVIGPSTNKGSGKVTVWHAPGLYAVDSAALSTSSSIPSVVNVKHQAAAGTVDASTDIVSTVGDCVIDSATAVNSVVLSNTSGKLYTPDSLPSAATNAFAGAFAADTARVNQLGIYCGHLKDSSIISTPLSLAAQGAASGTGDRDYGSAYSSTAEEFVIYFLGNQGLF